MTQSFVPEALFRPVMVLMMGRVLGFVAAFFIPVVLARAFDQNDFGTYKQLFLIHATLFGFAQLGMAESLYYFLPNASKRSGAFILNALVLMGASGLICALVLWWQSEAIAALLNNPQLAEYLPYIGIYLIFILMGLVLEIVLTIRKNHVGASISYATSDLVRALLFVAPVLWIADLGWVMGGAVAFALIRLSVTFLYLIRSRDIELKTNLPRMREHLNYALPFGFAGIIEVLQLNFHLYAVSYYFDAATFAIYAVGCLQVPLIDILMTSTSNVMMVNMRQKVLDDNLAAAHAIWLDSVRKISLVLFPLVTLLLLVAPVLIVVLFGEAYRASVPVFMVWTASTLLVCVLTDGVLRVFAQNRYLIFQNLLRLAIIVALVPLFINQLHLIGAVLVTTFAATVVKIVALQRVKFLMKTSWANVLPWRDQFYTALISIVAALPCLLLMTQVEQSAIATLLSVSALYSLSFALLLFGPGPLSREEKRQLKAWLISPFIRYRTSH